MTNSKALPSRIADKIRVTSACWEWEAAKDRHGYGKVHWEGRVAAAHRVVYEALIGSIPEGEQLDHLCRNPACVNPGHLEPVTSRENTRRGRNGILTTDCPQGHPYDTVNTYTDPRGRRHCRTCHREDQRRRRRREGQAPEGSVWCPHCGLYVEPSGIRCAHDPTLPAWIVKARLRGAAPTPTEGP